jgi:hypothetical protein
VLHLRLIILLVGGDISVDSETLLVTDFVNLKIKPTQFFKGVYRDRLCMNVFIKMICCVSKKLLRVTNTFFYSRFVYNFFPNSG